MLVITYYWPPAGGPGVQRWLRFISYLAEFGIEPVLYIPENPAYPMLDPSLEEAVPPRLRIYKKKISEPLQWAGSIFRREVKRISKGIIPERKPTPLEKLLLWVRGNFFIPDARVLWVKPSVRYLKTVLREEQIDTVVTTGPPHSLHLIGLRLKRQAGVRWVADFRDPWTSIGYHDKLRMGPRARKKHTALEKTVLGAADKILVTSKTTRDEFRGLTGQPVIVITNGYEASDYAAVPRQPDGYFSLSHIGSLLSGRNPRALWRALQSLCRENEAFRAAFRLRLVGVVAREVQDSIREFGLDEYTEYEDYLPHDKAVAMQTRSQLLLLVEIDAAETRGILPGKLFEYLASRRPILAIGPGGWEAGGIIRDMGAGDVFSYDEADRIKAALLRWFEAFQKGPLPATDAPIEAYSRKELTRALARELKWE